MKKPSSYLDFLPLILGVAGAVALSSYISSWVAIKPDSTIYLRMAEEIQKGHWHIDQWGRGAYSGVPMYPALVALVEWVIPGFDTAGTLVAIMSAAIAVVPLFFLARHFYGEKAAWIVIPLTIEEGFVQPKGIMHAASKVSGRGFQGVGDAKGKQGSRGSCGDRKPRMFSQSCSACPVCINSIPSAYPLFNKGCYIVLQPEPDINSTQINTFIRESLYN